MFEADAATPSFLTLYAELRRMARKPHWVDGPSRMLAQVTSALTNNLMQARLAEAGAGGTRLLSLVPRLERRVGLFDTAAMPYLVDAGRRAAESALPAIHALLARGGTRADHAAAPPHSRTRDMARAD